MAKPKIALSAGHHNAQRGNGVEIILTGKMCHETAKALRAHGGFDVRVLTPGDGLGFTTQGLDDLAQDTIILHRQGWTPDLYIEFHTQGIADPRPRGMFGIYPDKPHLGDVDTDTRDKLIPIINRHVSQATGVPIWTDGVMSENETGVKTLGIFRATAPLKAVMTRVLTENGTHSNGSDLAIMQRPTWAPALGRAYVAALCAYFGIPNTQPAAVGNTAERMFAMTTLGAVQIGTAATVATIAARDNGEYTQQDIDFIVRSYEVLCTACDVDVRLALAQMVHETAWLSSYWAGRPRRNPAGLGVTGTPGEGLSFDSWGRSATAHVGRLLAYALPVGHGTPEQQAIMAQALSYRALPDRYRGSATQVSDFGAGVWAADPDYEHKFARVAVELFPQG